MEAASHLALAGRFLLALPLSALPIAWREAVEDRLGLRAGAAGGPSAFIQFFGFGLLWVFGYRAWMQHQFDLIEQSARAAAESGRHDYLEVVMPSMAMMWANPIMPFLFTFTSLLGFLAFLFGAGGFVRLMSFAIASEPIADPTFLAIDFTRCKLHRSARVQVRERSKGPKAPDRVLFDDGSHSWDVRIESQHDYDWREGNTIAAAGRYFHLVERSEVRNADGHLRLRYDLKEIGVGVAYRGLRAYQPAEPPRYE